MSSSHEATYDPDGRIAAGLPLDRATHQQLITAVLAWTPATAPPTRDREQIALLLTASAHTVAGDVRRLADQLPDDSGPRTFARYILDEADRRLAAPTLGTLHCVQHRARLLRALYDRLDRLQSVTAASEPVM